jgi:hypothetical protein
MTALERIAGGSGTYFLGTTDQLVRNFSTIQVNAEVVISQLALVGGANMLTALNLTGATIVAGMIISAPMGTSFESITLTSGSILVS